MVSIKRGIENSTCLQERKDRLPCGVPHEKNGVGRECNRKSSCTFASVLGSAPGLVRRGEYATFIRST